MHEPYFQNIQARLHRRILRLHEADHNQFLHQLKRFRTFLDMTPPLATIASELWARFPKARDVVDGVLNGRTWAPATDEEAAAIGLPHEVKGNAIHAYVILKAGQSKGDHLVEELRNHVAHELGPIAKPEQITVVDSLPKTRSGKIMRRVLKARALGKDPGNITTLEE